MDNITDKITHCGYVALVGRPNVGKSTLLNRLIRQKISITSRKPQTTRHRILGIHTQDDYQMIYVDTPGIHQAGRLALHKFMNKTAVQVMWDVDVVAFVVEALNFTEEDEQVLEKLKNVEVPVVLVLNKTDRVKIKRELLPFIEKMSALRKFAAVISVSAKQGTQIEKLEAQFKKFLPESPFFYGANQSTDKSEKFMASEFVREQIFRCCGAELPYSVTVEIEVFKKAGQEAENSETVPSLEQMIAELGLEQPDKPLDTPKEVPEKTVETAEVTSAVKKVRKDNRWQISARILVDKENHKRMIIGNRGLKLKEIGTEARLSMEKYFKQKIFLTLWVKVKSGWADDERALKSLGYDSFL